jgi:cytochrome c oxidase cbb3-type subunit 3
MRVQLARSQSGVSRLAIAAWLLLLLTTACRGPSQPAAVTIAVPAHDSNVGPLPGQQDYDISGTVAGPAPFAADGDAIAEGRRYFLAYNCAGCHGDHGGGGMGPSLRDEVWLYGGTHAQIANSIAFGRAYGMPAWGKMLTQAQVWQLAAYIKTLRTEQEPQPPAGR